MDLTHAAFAEIVETSADGIWVIDLDGRTRYANPALAQIVGFPMEEMSRVTVFDTLDEVGREQFAAHLAQVRRGILNDGEVQTQVVRPDGSLRWVTVAERAERAEDGTITGLMHRFTDITEARGTLEALRHSQAHLLEVQAELRDQVSQNTLMEGVASAANEASSMVDVLGLSRHLLAFHDDWSRVLGFLLLDGEMTPVYADDEDRRLDESEPELMQAELALAERAAETREPVWSDDLTMIGTPVLLGEEVVAAYVLVATEPLERLAMVEDMVRQAAGLVSRVAERERAAREVAEARDEAMEASRQKSEFLALVSHEIRTPLNGVIGLNDLLLGTDLDDEQRRLAAGVEVSGRTLLRLINDILDFSKIEAGRLELEEVDFDVRAIVHRAAESHRSAAEAAGLSVDVHVDDDVPEVVNGDPTRYSQVVGNLLSNAVKFTDTGGVQLRVSVSGDGTGHCVRTDVVDTGIGIGGDPASLFEPFRQADVSTTRLYGGTGLGLAICQELVHALGGEIGVESQVGLGTRFWFTGTFSAPAGGTVLGRLQEASEAPEVDLVGRRGGEAVRVLVVEDHPVNQMVAVGLLESQGCIVAVADDGLAALAELDRTAYDLVLMDVHMPGLDGYETTRRIRAAEGERSSATRLPIVAMTASAVAGERERCLAAGMDDLVTKPVDPRELFAAVARWVGGVPGEVAVALDGDVGAPAAVLDTARLALLDETAPGYVPRALASMRERLPRHLVEIRAAVAAGDPAAVRASAHQLAGGADNVGLVGVAALARELEDLGRGGRLAKVDSSVARLEDAVVAADTALEAYVGSTADAG